MWCGLHIGLFRSTPKGPAIVPNEDTALPKRGVGAGQDGQHILYVFQHIDRDDRVHFARNRQIFTTNDEQFHRTSEEFAVPVAAGWDFTNAVFPLGSSKVTSRRLFVRDPSKPPELRPRSAPNFQSAANFVVVHRLVFF